MTSVVVTSVIMVVDIRATVTLSRKEVWESNKGRLPLEPQCGQKLVVDNGLPVPTYGSVEVELKVAGNIFHHQAMGLTVSQPWG